MNCIIVMIGIAASPRTTYDCRNLTRHGESAYLVPNTSAIGGFAKLSQLGAMKPLDPIERCSSR